MGQVENGNPFETKTFVICISKIEPPGLEIRNHLGSFGGDKKITTQLRRTDLRTVQVSRLAFAGTVPLSELLLARIAYLLLSVM